MKLWKIILILLVVIAAFFLFRSSPFNASYKNLPPTATGDWIAFGDSLTSGYGGIEGRDYPTLLSQKLHVTIRNFGVLGEKTEGALIRVEEIARQHPKVVLLCLGGNDALHSVPADKTFANLGVIIDRLQQEGTFVVLIGIRSNSILDKNATRFKKLAEEKGALYISNILGDVIGTPSLMSDYVHPNDAGYEFIATRLEKILLPFMNKITPPAK